MKKFGEYWKAVAAFLVPLGGLLTIVAASPEIQRVAPGPTAWLAAVAIPLITGLAALFVRNQQNADQVDTALEKGDLSVQDLEDLIEKWKVQK